VRGELTAAQFAAIAQLMRADMGAPSIAAASWVMVGGMKQADAARMAQISPAGVNNVVKRCTEVFRLCLIAANTAP